MIYLDNSASTQVLPGAAQAARQAMLETYANPSSLHLAGIFAERVMTDARTQIARSLEAAPEEILFTSGATEANNTAIFGAVSALKRRGNRVVTTSVEHPSVLKCFEALEAQGLEVVYVRPEGGRIDPARVAAAVSPGTILVSIMAVNGETGDILPVQAAAAAIRKAGAPALLHCDAVQAYGKIPVSPRRWGVDLMSVSAHKLHGPKGAGALYLRKGARITPLLLGGGQENGLRSGTENLPGIAGFGAAVAEIFAERAAFARQMDMLGAYLRRELGRVPGVVVNSPETGVAHIVNISLPPFLSENIIHFLEGREIYVSSASACAARSAQSGKGSRVLREYGISPERASSALRISLGIYNTQADIDALCAALADCREKLFTKK